MKEKTGIILVSLLAMLLLLLCACGKMQRAEICIEQIVAKEGNGENTEQLFMKKAEELFDRIASDGQGKEERHFFSINFTGSTPEMEVRIYRLTDGQWQHLYTPCDLTRSNVQLALMFDEIPREIDLYTSYPEELECNTPSDGEAIAGLGCFTAVLEKITTDVQAGDEIPLVMQGFMEGDTVTTFSLDEFCCPAVLAERNYERLYAVTIYVR